jgi:tricorn protease
MSSSARCTCSIWQVRKNENCHVRVPGEFPEVLPHFEKLEAKRILNANLSPTGARAVFEIHGEIVTVPAEKGDIRNLTNSPAVADRDPAWSPDGKRIAWFSDESGDYAMHIRDQNGLGEVTKIDLGNPPSYFYSPVWSPDNKKIAYTDKRLNLWYVDVEKGAPVKVDTDYYDSPFHTLNPTWSPDSKWLGYTKQLPSHLHAVYIYGLDIGQEQPGNRRLQRCSLRGLGQGRQVSVPDCQHGCRVGSELAGYVEHRPSRSRAACIWWCCRRTTHRRWRPRATRKRSRRSRRKIGGKTAEGRRATAAKTDEAKDKDKDKPSSRPLSHRFRRHRPAHHGAARAGAQLSGPGGGQRRRSVPAGSGRGFERATGPRADHSKVRSEETQGTDKLVDGVYGLRHFSQWREDAVQAGRSVAHRATGEPPKPDAAPLKLADMEVYVDPRAEWKQMYHEVWRIERDFLYDPHAHGLDLAAAEKFYAPFLDNISTRDDLNYFSPRCWATSPWACIPGRRRPAGAAQGQGRTAGRGLRHRERPLPVCENLQRRELESAASRPTHSARRQRQDRRLSARRKRTRGARRGRCL